MDLSLITSFVVLGSCFRASFQGKYINSLSVQTPEKNRIENTNITIVCVLNSVADQKSQLKWLYSPNIDNPEQMKENPDSYIIEFNNPGKGYTYSLTIVHASYTDSGYYTCDYGGKEAVTRPLNIYGSPVVNRTSPMRASVSIEINKIDFSISFSVTSNPASYIVWYFQNEHTEKQIYSSEAQGTQSPTLSSTSTASPLQNQSLPRITVQNSKWNINSFEMISTLTIGRVGEEHFGSYQCWADNGFGVSKSTVTIKALQAVYIIEAGGSKDLTYPGGSHIVLTCKTVGIVVDQKGQTGALEMYWKKQVHTGGKLTWEPISKLTSEDRQFPIEVDSFVNNSEQYSILRIRRAEYEDRGKYRCEITKPVKFTTVYINIPDVPVVSIGPQTVWEVAFDDEITATCYVQSPVALKATDIRWYRNNEQLISSDFNVISNNRFSKNITIYIQDETDYGEYICGVNTIKGNARGQLFIEDNNECVDPYICDGNLCVDEQGGYKCICNPGYYNFNEGNGPALDCRDKNECLLQKDICGNSICENLDGSYSCHCDDGFFDANENSTSIPDCRDVDECAIGDHVCSHYCKNTVGDYECSCPSNLDLDSDLRTCITTSQVIANNLPAIVGGVVGGVVAVALGIAAACFIIHKRRNRKFKKKGYNVSSRYASPKFKNQFDESQVYKNIHLTGDEFPRARIKLHEDVGEGKFGKVAKAEALGIQGKDGWEVVAVKMCKDSPSEIERNDLLKELKVLRLLTSHVNVVQYLGCCIKSDPPLIILEYVNGDNLQNHLRKFRPDIVTYSSAYYSMDNIPSSNEMTKYALDIARGMSHISIHKIIHRDLAARNILLGSDNVCKICDFGLARHVDENDTYEMSAKGPLPIRWMPPEALGDNIFTMKSDVWSYGVLLWEIVTLGSSPYPGMSTSAVMASVFTDRRMEKPPQCSDELYSIMLKCWSGNSDNRPSFRSLLQTLESTLETETAYMQFDNYSGGVYHIIEQTSDERV